MTSHHTILLISDSVRTKAALLKILSEDFKLIASNSKAIPFSLLFEKQIDFIIIDSKTKFTPAIQLSEQLRLMKNFATSPVLFLMNKNDVAVAEEAIASGISNFLYRPLKEEQVKTAILLAKKYKKTVKTWGDKSKKLQKIAEHDVLTKLYNRWALYEMGRKEIAKTIRSGLPLSFLMIDLDHFKEVNDNYGHSTGDLVLQNFSQLLTKTLRSYDIIARYGGEEFVVLLPNTNAQNARLVGQKVCKRTEETELTEHKEIKLTVSIGIASLSKDCDTLEKLIEEADQAMYQAKKQGRNQVASLSPD